MEGKGKIDNTSQYVNMSIIEVYLLNIIYLGQFCLFSMYTLLSTTIFYIFHFFDCKILQNAGVRGGEWEERSAHTCSRQEKQSMGWKGKMYHHVNPTLPRNYQKAIKIQKKNQQHQTYIYYSNNVIIYELSKMKFCSR